MTHLFNLLKPASSVSGVGKCSDLIKLLVGTNQITRKLRTKSKEMVTLNITKVAMIVMQIENCSSAHPATDCSSLLKPSVNIRRYTSQMLWLLMLILVLMTLEVCQ